MKQIEIKSDKKSYKLAKECCKFGMYKKRDRRETGEAGNTGQFSSLSLVPFPSSPPS